MMPDCIRHYILYPWDMEYTDIKFVVQENVYTMPKERVKLWEATQQIENVNSVHTVGVHDNF